MQVKYVNQNQVLKYTMMASENVVKDYEARTQTQANFQNIEYGGTGQQYFLLYYVCV